MSYEDQEKAIITDFLTGYGTQRCNHNLKLYFRHRMLLLRAVLDFYGRIYQIRIVESR